MADAPVTPDVIYRIARVLEQDSAPYAFIGGVALSAWAVPRSTFDVDLAVSMEESRGASLLKSFEKAGFVLDPVFESGFRDRLAGMEKMHVHLPEAQSLLIVDIFLASTAFVRSVVARRVKVDMGHGPLPICTAADLVLFKLLANRKKDQADLENLFSSQGVPEREYLERWAKVLKIGDRLEETLRGLK